MICYEVYLVPGNSSCFLVNIGSGNDVFPDDTKPLPEPMLTNTWEISITNINFKIAH